MPVSKKVTVLENSYIVNGIKRLVVDIEGVHGIKPGQFFMLRSWETEPVLGRPISVCEVKDNTLVFLYAVTGRGTKMLSENEPGSQVEIMGPLGNGFDLSKISGKVALVAGGIGVAPMVELSKNIKGAEVDLYVGFRSDVYAVDEIKPYVKSVNVSTEDGSTGHKGYVTEIFQPEKYDVVLCCGPEVMMNRVLMMCREAGTKIYVSMEKHMACGVGACLVCTCKTKEGHKRTCKEGPVFDGDEIVID